MTAKRRPRRPAPSRSAATSRFTGWATARCGSPVDGIWGDPPDRDRARAALRRAVELDVNFIDTADSYGPEVSETLIAETLYPYPDDLVIATKGGLVRPGAGPLGRAMAARSTCARRARAACGGCGWTRSRCTSSTPRPEGSPGGLARRPGRAEGRGQDPARRGVERLRGAGRGGPADHARGVGAEPLQRERPLLQSRSWTCARRRCSSSCPWAPIQETDRIVPVLSAAKRHGVSELARSCWPGCWPIAAAPADPRAPAPPSTSRTTSPPDPSS